MERKLIIRMAREVWGERAILPFNELKAFAALVAAHERENSAKMQADCTLAAVLAEREACAELFESAPNQEWSSELVAYQIRNMRRSHQSKG